MAIKVSCPACGKTLHEDCLSAAREQEQVTRRSKRWTYDVDKYLAAMRQRLERELANPQSERIKRYRAPTERAASPGH